MSVSVDIQKDFGSFKLTSKFELGAETLGLLGASGCGKSLTMRCIAGVDTPDSGRIVVNDKVYFDSEKHINLSAQERKTALLFQNYQLFPNLTVEQNIAAGIDHNISKAEKQQIVQSQMKRFQIEGFEKRYPVALSGGQQQRVALARMLAAKPEILMLDEPFSALDAHLKAKLEVSLIGLFDEYKGSILYVSHDIDEVLRFCNKIAVMDNGDILEFNDAHEIVANPKTLAGIRLSGVKNTSRAEYVEDYKVRALDWGDAILTVDKPVDSETKYIGYRAFLIQQAKELGENVIPCKVEHFSESRFERTYLVRPISNAGMCQQIQWKRDTLGVDTSNFPRVDDIVYLHFNSKNIYPAKR